MVTQTGFFYLPGAEAQPIPRVFLVLPHEFLQAQAKKKFHGIEPGVVHGAERRQHHARGHAVSPETDIAVA